MRRGSGPRQPGGGKQIAGPRHASRPGKGGRPQGGRPGKPGRSRDDAPRGAEARAHQGRSEKPRFEKSDREAPREERSRTPRFGRPDREARPPREERSRKPRFDESGREARPPREERSRGSRFDKPDRDTRPPRDEPSRKPRFDRAQRNAAPRPEERQAKPPREEAPLPTAVQTSTVTSDENGMRLDRFFEARFPGLSFSHIQRIIRKGEVRVNGRRMEPKDRLEAGQSIRIPPLRLDQPKPFGSPEDEKTRAFLKSITLHEDDDVLVLNKPMGLAVQGGSGTTRHVDGMLGALRERDGQRPRLVHRLDKDTAGCLLVAKTRFAAAALAKSFRSRSARKIYWALVAGVPRPAQGRISTYLAKEEREEDSFMRVAEHGDEGASHAVTYYAVVETAGRQLSWVSLKPVTGRTHQLRAHMAHISHPIVGDPKYFERENWDFPGGMQNRLHLLARRIVVPHPRGGTVDVTAPLPPHMAQSWNLLGFDAKRFDPIVDAPEE